MADGAFSGGPPAIPASLGLKQFSKTVWERVQQKRVTNYDEVADELLAETKAEIVANARERARLQAQREGVAMTEAMIKAQLPQFDDRNVRRRVYDALNVLTAVGVIDKDRSKIVWKGTPSRQKDAADFLAREVTARYAQAVEKRKAIRDLVLQQVALRRLCERNKALEAQLLKDLKISNKEGAIEKGKGKGGDGSSRSSDEGSVGGGARMGIGMVLGEDSDEGQRKALRETLTQPPPHRPHAAIPPEKLPGLPRIRVPFLALSTSSEGVVKIDATSTVGALAGMPYHTSTFPVDLLRMRFGQPYKLFDWRAVLKKMGLQNGLTTEQLARMVAGAPAAMPKAAIEEDSLTPGQGIMFGNGLELLQFVEPLQMENLNKRDWFANERLWLIEQAVKAGGQMPTLGSLPASATQGSKGAGAAGAAAGRVEFPLVASPPSLAPALTGTWGPDLIPADRAVTIPALALALGVGDSSNSSSNGNGSIALPGVHDRVLLTNILIHALRASASNNAATMPAPIAAAVTVPQLPTAAQPQLWPAFIASRLSAAAATGDVQAALEPVFPGLATGLMASVSSPTTNVSFAPVSFEPSYASSALRACCFYAVTQAATEAMISLPNLLVDFAARALETAARQMMAAATARAGSAGSGAGGGAGGGAGAGGSGGSGNAAAAGAGFLSLLRDLAACKAEIAALHRQLATHFRLEPAPSAGSAPSEVSAESGEGAAAATSSAGSKRGAKKVAAGVAASAATASSASTPTSTSAAAAPALLVFAGSSTFAAAEQAAALSFFDAAIPRLAQLKRRLALLRTAIVGLEQKALQGLISLLPPAGPIAIVKAAQSGVLYFPKSAVPGASAAADNSGSSSAGSGRASSGAAGRRGAAAAAAMAVAAAASSSSSGFAW